MLDLHLFGYSDLMENGRKWYTIKAIIFKLPQDFGKPVRLGKVYTLKLFDLNNPKSQFETLNFPGLHPL